MELDWQTGFQSVKDRGLFLLKSKAWTDCRFLVGCPPNQRILSGHKVFLAMSSPVFERMFYSDLADVNDPIVIPDVKPDVFQAMLVYIYSDRIDIKSFDKACALCYVAKKYMLPHLVEQCVQYLRDNINRKTACQAYEFAKLFEEKSLITSSLNFIVNNTRDVLMDPGFMDIETSTLLDILDQGQLNITSELDLFNALNKYSEERGLLQSISRLFLTDAENLVPKNENETTGREDNNT